MKKKILVIYTCYGTGHYKSAKAIVDELSKKAEVKMFDPLTYSRPIANHFFNFVGTLFSTKLRKNRGALYKEKMYKDYLKESKFAIFCTKLFWTKKLQRKIEEFNPDIIVSTQVGPTILMASHKKEIKAKLVSVFTDYGVHRWYVFPHKNIDQFCVPSLEIKKELINLGLSESKIKVTGIPVSKEFTSNYFNKMDTLNKYELNNKPLFLFVCGGGLGYNNGFPYFEELLRLKEDFSYIFISGSNKKLYKQALELAEKYNKLGKVFGYVDNMAELINASDLVIGKPGGILTSETIAIGKPFCAIEPIPGQEEKNIQFLTSNNFGFYSANKKEFVDIMKKILKNKNILNNYCQNVNRLEIKNSAHLISEIL